MRRAPLVLTGTVAGIAAVIGFPLSKSVVALPAAATGNGTATTTTGAASGGHGTSRPAAASGAAAAPGAASAAGAATAAGGAVTRAATGALESYPYGSLAVTVTATGNKITKVSLASLTDTDPHSAAIDNYVTPLLEQQVMAADSARISGISGATFTSQAFASSVASALKKLGIA